MKAETSPIRSFGGRQRSKVEAASFNQKRRWNCSPYDESRDPLQFPRQPPGSVPARGLEHELGAPVFDKTELGGGYDFTLEFRERESGAID